MIETFAFYLFAGILVLSALMVIAVRNPVHSVLFLILGFFNAAGLFVMLGAEFIAFILVIVYVGAVAVLFLFVVMMLDIDFANLRKGAMRYVPLGILLGGVFMFELVPLYLALGKKQETIPGALSANGDPISNTEALGMVLYTDYLYAFQGAGLILLVAMVGAIVLTLRRRPGVRKQRVSEQFARKREDVIEIHKIAPRTGFE